MADGAVERTLTPTGSDSLLASWESDETYRQDVSSSNVRRAGYSPTFRRFFLEFLDGSVYAYSPVPWTVWSAFLNAPSPGRFVYDEIRGAKGRRGLKFNDVDTVYSCLRVK